MSRKSKAETDWEEMDIDEVDIRIEEQETAIAKEQRQLNIVKFNKNKKTAKQVEEEAKPLEANLKFRIKFIAMLYEVKDYKIPFYEKLPKDHMFYKHLMTNMSFKRMKNAATEKAEENKVLFEDAGEKLLQDQANAKRFQSPSGASKKRHMYA